MFSNEAKKALLKNRRHLLQQRNPVANANIIRKIDRQLRKLEK